MASKKVKKESVSGDMPTPIGDRLEFLHDLFPEVFVEGKLDIAKFREAAGDIVDDRPERYSFNWSGKRDAIRLLQVQSRATLIPRPEDSLNWDTTKNLFVEGDNLEVLKLLYKSYAGRVRLIYIDPPYNTGQDFIYPDNFADPLDTYLKLSGQKDSVGNLLTSNPETNGRYHSSWLSMMYPRLFLARQLMAEDGAIFISIDDHEVHDLRLLMNEIFGEENFVACFIWQKRTTRENRKVFSFNHDYVLCYAKNKLQFQAARNLLPLSDDVKDRYENPDNDSRGDWQSVSLNAQAGPGRRKEQFYSVTTPSGRVVDPPPGRCWTLVRERMDELIADKRVWFGADGNNVPREKVFLSEAKDGLTPHTLWTAEEVGTTDTAKKALIKLFDGAEVYDTPKPMELLDRIIGIGTACDAGDIVLDFFAGSCTTAHSVLAANANDNGNRRFISIQIPEPTPLDTGARKAGFENIAEICRQRLRLACKQVGKKENGKLDLKVRQEPLDLGFRAFQLSASHNRQWTGIPDRDAESLGKQMALFVDPLLPGWTPLPVLHEVAMREGYSLSCLVEELPKKSTKPNTVYRVSDPEKDQKFMICLDDKLSAGIAKALDLDKDDLFICRDVALNDEIAANLALQCRLKTI